MNSKYMERVNDIMRSELSASGFEDTFANRIDYLADMVTYLKIAEGHAVRRRLSIWVLKLEISRLKIEMAKAEK